MKNWLMFLLLSAIWGSSFLLIKIGLAELNPFVLVSGRLSLAALAFVLTLLVIRKPLPRDRKTILSLIAVGILNNALPFILITWGEQTIDSGLAGVLDATVPLFSFVMAHLALSDDKLNRGKLMGLAVGFLGVLILALRGTDPTHENPLMGQVAVLVASFSYACSAVILRRNLQKIDSFVIGGGSLVVGAVVVVVGTLLTGQVWPSLGALQSKTILAILTLGIINTFIAYLLYFTLIRNWGASRATMVTYMIPPVSLLLGVAFGSERLDLAILLGAALIIGGVVVANIRRPQTSQPPVGAEATIQALPEV